MGSSKKHKEKRDKKRHKRSRSRSHSYEKEVRRKSHKKEKERRRSRERYDYEDEEKLLEARRKLEDSKRFEQASAKYDTVNLEDDDEFDVEKLLDSKLSEQLSHNSKKIQERKSRLQDFRKEALAKLGNVSKEKQYRSDHDESFERFANQMSVDDERELHRDYYQEEPVDDDVGTESGQAQSSLSIEETNKLRAKLGLKPLDVSEQIPGLSGGDELESKSSEKKNEVFVKTENIAEMEQAQKLRERIQTMKEKRKINEKLRNIKPLAASDTEEEESAEAWVMKSRKLQEEKKRAEERAKLLEEMDAEFGIGALVEEEFDKKKKGYTSRDLRGLTVEHDIQVFKEGQQTILTLKDKGVLDEEDDVLQNVNLIDEERYARNIENKKKKPDYRPYDEEYDEFGILQKKNLLSKYDEEIHGHNKKSFVIGSAAALNKEKELEVIRMKLKQEQGVSLEMPALKIASEYYTSDDMVQFKKPKKVKKKLRKRLKADDLIPDTDMQRDFGSRIKKEIKIEDEFLYGKSAVSEVNEDVEMVNAEVEEEEDNRILDEKPEVEQFALSKVKKLKSGKTVTNPEQIVVESLMKSGIKEDIAKDSKNPQIILNSTAEFCRTLGDIPTYGMSGNRDEDAEELMDFERELLEERERRELEAQNKGAWNAVDIDETPVEISIRENEPILEEEPDVGSGVAGALKLAQKKGYLDKDIKKLLSGPRNTHLQAQSYTIEEKFYDDDKFGKRDRYTGPIQDFREKSSYRPDVKLEYIDDNGRLLNSKEAFRYLSHKFHGKGPGKNKVDKRMKKLDQDNKLKQMSSTDTPLNTVKLLQAKQKEMQSPYITLSGGSKALTQTMISKIKPT